jgi:hypothetical protein
MCPIGMVFRLPLAREIVAKIVVNNIKIRQDTGYESHPEICPVVSSRNICFAPINEKTRAYISCRKVSY